MSRFDHPNEHTALAVNLDGYAQARWVDAEAAQELAIEHRQKHPELDGRRTEPLCSSRFCHCCRGW